jgi:lipopolysaccharide assembly protein A
MKYLLWLLKAAIFFTLFAFALNNQQDATVHFFFGTQWRAPMVLLVLTAFAAGLVMGVLGMVPRWWKHRSAARKAVAAHPAAPAAASTGAEGSTTPPAAGTYAPASPLTTPQPPFHGI